MAVDWDVEVVALEDLSVTVPRSHLLTINALRQAFAEAANAGSDGPLNQKVLLGKMAAENIAALENLGAISWAVANRKDQGILRRYLGYTVADVRNFYQDTLIRDMRDVFDLPSQPDVATTAQSSDVALFAKGMVNLEANWRIAATNYGALNGELVKTYNKIKHGFPIIVRLDKLIPSSNPPNGWEQHVNVLTKIDDGSGNLHYTSIERTTEMLDHLPEVTRGVCDTWREVALLVLFMREKGLPLS